MGEIGAMVARLEEEGLDLNRLIDDELQAVDFLSLCSRSTASLSNRADIISGSQNELKTLLKSIEDQLRKIQQEENLPSSILEHGVTDDTGVKHIIVIDDEEETPKNDFSCQINMETETSQVPMATSSTLENAASKSVSPPTEPLKTTHVSSTVSMQAKQAKDRKGVPTVPVFPKPTTKVPETTPKGLMIEEGIIGYRTLKSPTESGGATVTSMVTLKSSQPTIPPQHLRSTTTPSMPSASARTAIPDTRSSSTKETDTPTDIPVTTHQQKRPPSPPKFDEGTRIIGKRADDLWYPGEIIKVIKDRYNQVKFRVKFDQGNRGLLRSNHIALESSPPLDVLHVGSRVVALRPRETADEAASWREAKEGPYGKLDVLYAGIVAEICCPQNSNRFLIFFDDGFAQYLPLQKLHHVYHTGDKVWNEVAEHSQEFIQEYLEEFPNRPMVVLKTNQWVKTEWRGKWLKAKVMQVDCSLVKMLFQVDNRSEWIYRGSTRLEPLYKALVDGKISKSKKNKRQQKKALQNTDEPHVDMSLTSPHFGFSLYSKTDPKGKKQEESEKNRNESAAKQAQQGSEGSTKTSSGGKDTSQSSSKFEQNSSSKESETSTKAPGSSNNNNNKNNTTPPTTTATQLPRVITKHTIGTNTLNMTPNNNNKKTVGINTTRTNAPRNILPNNQETTVNMTGVNSTCSVPDSTISIGWSNSPVNHIDDSTASIIQASTMRKRTTAGLITKTNYNHVGANMVTFGGDSTAVMTSKMVNNGAVSVMSPIKNKLKWEAPWKQRKIHTDGNILKKPVISNSKHDAAALIQERLQAEKKLLHVLKPLPEIKPLIPKPAILGPHKCGKHCGQTKQVNIKEKSKHNMLSLPLMLNWKRQITKRHPRSKKDIYYRAPCNKRLRSIADVGKYLTLTGTSNVTIDQFCFDPDISCTDRTINTKNILLPDISHGAETVSISVVNEHDSSYPPPIDYVSDRILSEGVNIVTEPGFLACCDCTDNCQDKSKCSCAQLTISASAAVDGKEDIAAGYEYRKLMDCVPTGIYECNQNCACSSQCFNRVVQNGIQLRLQVFKTVDRGWGLRTLDDIPVGTFICTYSGQVMNEDMANKEGRDFGDEYLAELDHIEVVEKIKEGYESSVSDIEDDSVILKTLDDGSSECSDNGFMSDSNMSSDTDSVISDNSSLYEPVYRDTVTPKTKSRKKDAKKPSSVNTSPSKDDAVIIKEDGKTFRVTMADEKYVVASSSDTGSIVLRRISLPSEETTEHTNQQSEDQSNDPCGDPPPMPCEPTVIDLTSSDEDESISCPAGTNNKQSHNDDNGDDCDVKNTSKPSSSSGDHFDLCLDISTESSQSCDIDQGHVTDTTAVSSQDRDQLLRDSKKDSNIDVNEELRHVSCHDNSDISTDLKSKNEVDITVKMELNDEISDQKDNESTSTTTDIENDKEIVENHKPSSDVMLHNEKEIPNSNQDLSTETLTKNNVTGDKPVEISKHNDVKVTSDDHDNHDNSNHDKDKVSDTRSEHDHVSSVLDSNHDNSQEVDNNEVNADVKEAVNSFVGQGLDMDVDEKKEDAADQVDNVTVNHDAQSSSASSEVNHDQSLASPEVNHDLQSSSASPVVNHDLQSASPDVNHDQSSASPDVNHDLQSSSASPVVNHDQSSASPDVNHDLQSASASPVVNHDQSSASPDVNHDQSLASPDVNHDQSSASPGVNHDLQSSSASPDVNHDQSSSASPDVNHDQSSSASPDVNHDLQSSSASSDVNHDLQSSSASSDDSVPPLMSADDLSKLAAQLHQPDEEPPKLTKMECGIRLTDLKDTITKLQSRGVALDGVSPETVQDSTPSFEDLPLFPETSSCDVDSFPPSPASTDSDSSVTDSAEKSSETSFDHRVRVKNNSSGRRARRFIVTLQKNGVKRSASPGMTGDSPVKKPTTRSLFGEEHCYVIDAKAYGNCGRYLNHSCSPNLFVQNVFIDTHDLRFPRVAFFAQHNISAGSELTWDYMYEVGSVQDKVLRCYCGSSQCRGRLL